MTAHLYLIIFIPLSSEFVVQDDYRIRVRGWVRRLCQKSFPRRALLCVRSLRSALFLAFRSQTSSDPPSSHSRHEASPIHPSVPPRFRSPRAATSCVACTRLCWALRALGWHHVITKDAEWAATSRSSPNPAYRQQDCILYTLCKWPHAKECIRLIRKEANPSCFSHEEHVCIFSHRTPNDMNENLSYFPQKSFLNHLLSQLWIQSQLVTNQEKVS